MKYAFMTFSTPELSWPDVLDVARKYGYGGVEPRIDEGQAHGIEAAASANDRTTFREQAAAAGIDIACVATSISYADPARSDEMIRRTHERIDLAGDIGAPTMRVFGGGIGGGLSREQAIDLLVESLGSVADHAAERDVVICVETHDDWCDPAHVAEVLRRVDRRSVGANWDIMHPVRTKQATMDEAFDALCPWIRHLHVHDGPAADGNLIGPIGAGEIDHRRALELLMTIDYDGYISGEWIGWEPYDIHLPRELAVLKGYEAELTAG